MKTKADLSEFVDQIKDASSPVGMDAVYVHAAILEKLERIEQRLELIEQRTAPSASRSVSETS